MLMLANPALPIEADFHAIIEDVIAALPKYIRQGYSIAVEPFHIARGRCAILQDSRGHRVCIFEKHEHTRASLTSH